MSHKDENKREDDRAHQIKRNYSPIGLHKDAGQRVERNYSPIGLTFTSAQRDEPCEEEVVRSIKIISAGPHDPIPTCEGYDLAYIVPNATLSEAAALPPLHLAEPSTVYVFVKFE